MQENVKTYNEIIENNQKYPFYYVKLKEKHFKEIQENEMLAMRK